MFDLVTSFIAPLPLLRQTVEAWLATLQPESSLYDSAERVSLVLNPTCVADKAQIPKRRHVPLLPEEPHWTTLLPLPCVLTGSSYELLVKPPPRVCLAYPFTAAIPPGRASATADWLREAVSAIAEACEKCAEQPISIKVGGQAQAILGPVLSWLCDLGIQGFNKRATLSPPNRFTRIYVLCARQTDSSTMEKEEVSFKT